MSLEKKRMERIGIMLSLINKCSEAGKELDVEKLIAVMMCDFGCSRRTALEYYNALKNSGKIKK